MSEQLPVIVSARRTPIGAFQGALASLTATQLGSVAARAAITSADMAPERIQEVIFGCVLPAGLGQAPARQAAVGAGVPTSVPAMTINKMCGSGLKAVMSACDQIRTGDVQVALAGGLESMTNAPYLLAKARRGYRMGHGELIDHMFRDGLQSPFDGQLIGCFAEATARRYGFTRQQQDAYAVESVSRSMRAIETGAFSAELVPVTTKERGAEVSVDRDETPFTCNISRIPKLAPAFSNEGTVTAASSASISDGAAALVLMSRYASAAEGVRPLAQIAGYTSHAQDPEWFTTAPVGAVRKLLERLGWDAADVDLYEINEAFAVVTMAAIKELELDPERVNVNGGACALGHPVGATGARLLTTLVHALRRRGGNRGIASLCLGGGEAVAVAVEII